MGNKHQGPFCQSCGMPLERPEDFGMGSHGLRINDYCCYCYNNGAFTEPEITMQEMIDKCIGFLVQQKTMPETEAKTMITEFIPTLKRWRRI